MSVTDIPVLSLIKDRLKWHEARQRVLAENIANADMPGFRPSDLEPMAPQDRRPMAAPVHLAVTHEAHLAASKLGQQGGFANRESAGWETTPDGNAVVLEEQMMKLTENQMDHQTASTLYGRGIALLRTAVRSG